MPPAALSLGSCAAALLLLAVGARSAPCRCAFTSGDRASCCSKADAGGEGTGDFCGNLFSDHRCGGETPVCCTSDVSGASCCPAGSSCSPACKLGYKGRCSCIPAPAPSPASRAYDPRKARAVATLAQGAGCHSLEELRTFSCPACREVGFDIAPGTMQFVSHEQVFSHNATFAYIARLQRVGAAGSLSFAEGSSDYGCVVSIRGTDNAANVLADLEFWKQDLHSLDGYNCTGCGVHSGFFGTWADMQEDALSALEKAGCTPKGGLRRVLVTGHSLGAAAALVAMFNLQTLGFDVNQTFVFEPPRVGNDAFANTFPTRFGREIPAFLLTHAQDPVVHLPPKDVPGVQYHHVAAPEVYFYPSGDSDDYIVCEQAGDARCSNRYDLVDCVASGQDHCRLPLAPVVNPQGNRDFCYFPSDFCSGHGTTFTV